MRKLSVKNDFEPVHSMVMRSISTKAVMAAVELKLFDAMETPVSLAELADTLGLVADRLEPVLDILVSVGMVEHRDGRYENSGLASEYLVSSAPLYQGLSMQLTMQFVATVEDSIAGLVAGEEIDRTETDNRWGVDDVMEGTAQDAVGSGLGPVVDVVAALPGFDGFRTMCDIGGNHGEYTMGVLDRNEEMRGTIFDLPHVAKQSRARCEKLGYGGRIGTEGLDFREGSLPESAFDLAMTSHVLYGFKDDLNAALGRIAHGLKQGGWFVSHHYAGRRNGHDPLTTASLELLTRLCGYPSHFVEREDLVEALTRNGFADIRHHPVSENGLGLITVARKVG